MPINATCKNEEISACFFGKAIMDTLLEILQNLHPDTDFKTHASLIDDGILDSFDIVSIIAEISDKFDVSVPAEDITPENFNSARALYALIERLDD